MSAIASATRMSGSSASSSNPHHHQQQHKPLMKLTVDKDKYRKTYLKKAANHSKRTLGEKREVRSSILASLDRQLSHLDKQQQQDNEDSLSSMHVPFESVVSNQVLWQQSQRLSYQEEDEEVETFPSPKTKSKKAPPRYSARTTRILESLDKHLVVLEKETRILEEDEEEEQEPSTPKKTSSPSSNTSSKRTSNSTLTTSENTSRASKSPKRSKKSRTPSRKKKPSSRSLASASVASSSATPKSPKRTGVEPSKKKKKKRRSVSMESPKQKSTTREQQRSSSLSRPSTHSTISTASIPLHLHNSSSQDGSSKLASVLTTGNNDTDVVIANLVPTTIISKKSMGGDDETASTMTSAAHPKKKKKKKKKQRGSMGSKRSYDSSLNTSSFDKSLNSTSVAITIEEGEERSTSASSHPALAPQQQEQDNAVWGTITPGVAIANLSPIPPPPMGTPPESPETQARTSGSSFDSEQQFEHFYAEPTKRSSVLSRTFDEEEFEEEELEEEDMDETEAAMDEEIDLDLMEASMSLSDIFGNLKDDKDIDDEDEDSVVIGNLAPAPRAPSKQEMTVRPHSHSPARGMVAEEESQASSRKPKTKKKKRWSLRSQRTVDQDIVEEQPKEGGSTRGRSPSARSKTPEKKRFSFRQQRTVDSSFEQQQDDVSTRSNRKANRWSLRGQRTVDVNQDSGDNNRRGSTRSFRTVDSWFGKGSAAATAAAQEEDQADDNSQDLASEQRLAAIFGAQGPGFAPTSPILPQSSYDSPKKQSKNRVEIPPPLQDEDDDDDDYHPRTPTAEDYNQDQDEKSRDRIREIFGADHHLALASPEPQKRKGQERRGSLGSVFSARSTRSARSTDSIKRKTQSSIGSLHSRFTNRSKGSNDRSGRSRGRSVDNNSSAGASVFSDKSGRSRARSIDGSIDERDRPQFANTQQQSQQERRGSFVSERRGSMGSLHSRLSMKSAGSSSIKKNKDRKKKERSRSPLKRAFSPKKSRSPPPKRVSEPESPGRPLDDDILIVEGVLKRYDTEQCRTFEDHQEMAEAELISSITNTTPAELRRLKNKLAERLRTQLVASNNYHTEDDSVTNSDHLIEVGYDDPSDVTSLTSMTSFTNFGGASVRSGSIGGFTFSKSSRTLDRPSNSAMNYQHPDDDDELVFVKSLPIYGGKYSGTVCPHSSQPHGNGRMVYRGSKGIYTGEWKQGQWNGKGKHIKANGDYYEGTFLDNLYHGEGVFSYKQSGRFFEGQYVMGERTKGTMRYADGSVYKGQFYHGRRHGRGSYTFKDGSRYKGDFYKDLMQGIGELRFRDGSSYVGEWKRGRHEGQGSMYSPDGMLCWAGMWKDGQQVLA